MTPLAFTPVADGLYVAKEDVQPSSTAVYWVLLFGHPPAGDVAPADTWTTYGGCHVLVPRSAPVTDPRLFVQNVTKAFGAPDSRARAIAWASDAAAATIVGFVKATPDGTGTFKSGNDLVLPLANVAFTASVASTVSFLGAAPVPGGGPALVLGPADPSAGLLGITRANTTSNLFPAAGQAFVPLGGASAGAVVFPARWNRWSLYQLFSAQVGRFAVPAGVEIQYFHGTLGAEQSLRYPVFPGNGSGTDPTQDLALNVSVDPLAVFDPARTVFALDLGGFGGGGGAVLPTCTTFATTDGGQLTLTPQAGAGIAFGRRPKVATDQQAGAYAYLTPTGPFAIQAGGPAIRHVMCGLTTTEYLLHAQGATIEFVPGGKAWCDVFTAPPPSPGTATNPCTVTPGGNPVAPDDLLKATYTTAWVRVDPPSPTDLIDRGYAMQAEASVYHGGTTDAKSPYPQALGCRVSTLQKDGGPPAPLPVAPYGGVWSTGADASALPSPATLRAFESQVLAGARFDTAPKDMTYGPTIFDAVEHTGLSGGAMTPLGLLANLNSNPAGTFASLQLAKSATDDGTPILQFTGNPVMAPDVSYALMNANLFMVVTDGSRLGSFQNEAQLGEWTFQLDADWGAGATGDYADTILVFKFTTARSAVDLVADAATWQEWSTFIDPDPSLAATKIQYLQKRVLAAFCQAQDAGPDSIFGDFLQKIGDPNWTGILAINCGLDASKLPIDLQDLLGGITGRLRAHHFGLTVNRIKGATPAEWTIDASSLFAVIHYDANYAPAPWPPPYGFQVLKLNVQFENSALVHFDSRIAVTIPSLFGTEVVLPKSTDPHVPDKYNVIEIDGVYQRHGKSGTVVFDTKAPLDFAVKTASTGFRALDRVHVTDAALVPVSSTTSQDKKTITVQSHLALSGLLMFVKDVSGAAKANLDLFSYGDPAADPATGLAFSSYNLAMTTTIVADQGTLAPITQDLTQFRVSPETSKSRTSSLVQALPLKVTAFLQQPSVTGWPVTFKGKSGQSFTPDYALQLQGSLGSLGALASAGLDINLVIAWKAAHGANDDQLSLTMVPPKGFQGALAFGIQGVMTTTFSEVELVQATWPKDPPNWSAYGMYFKNVHVWLLGLPLVPPAALGVANFTLFAHPKEGAASNIGWLMTSTLAVG